MGSADRVEVHYARLPAVIGYEKRFHTAWVIFRPQTAFEIERYFKSLARASPELELNSLASSVPS